MTYVMKKTQALRGTDDNPVFVGEYTRLGGPGGKTEGIFAGTDDNPVFVGAVPGSGGTGALAGAAVGGLLGALVAKKGKKSLFATLGAVVGGLAGHLAAKPADSGAAAATQPVSTELAPVPPGVVEGGS